MSGRAARIPPDTDPALLAHFTEGVEEQRLNQNPLEFERTKELLTRWLPPTGHVLDVGGGPGPYASLLASQGYEVDLVDPIPLHIEEARKAAHSGPGFGAHVGDARHLPFADSSADAVLLMGPLYYLPDAHDRADALSEAFRVLRPGGVLFASTLGRLARLVPLLRGSLAPNDWRLDALLRTLETGIMPSGSMQLYAHRPEELVAEVTNAGFAEVAAMAVDIGILGLSRTQERLSDPPSRSALLSVLHQVESDPGVLGFAEKLAAVGRRPT